MIDVVPLPPSGKQLHIAAGPYDATIVTCGAGLRTLRHRGTDVVNGYAEDEVCSAGRGQVLAPWPNRVRDGVYVVDGADLQLDLSEPSRHNAIHGLVRWVTWNVSAHSDAAVTLEYLLSASHAFPFTLALSIAYALGDDGLTVTTTAVNAGATKAPWGLGFHPYLAIGGELIDGLELQLPGTCTLDVDERLVPTGTTQPLNPTTDFATPRRIGSTALDTCYAELLSDVNGVASTRLTNADTALTLWQDRSFGYLMVFTGDGLPVDARRRGVAVEPMTCPPNALQTGADLAWLAPGEQQSSAWGIVAG